MFPVSWGCSDPVSSLAKIMNEDASTFRGQTRSLSYEAGSPQCMFVINHVFETRWRYLSDAFVLLHTFILTAAGGRLYTLWRVLLSLALKLDGVVTINLPIRSKSFCVVPLLCAVVGVSIGRHSAEASNHITATIFDTKTEPQFTNYATTSSTASSP